MPFKFLVSRKDFSSQSALIIIILKNRPAIATDADAGKYDLSQKLLSAVLKNDTLTNKPKLMLIQASKDDLATTDQYSQLPVDVLKFYNTFEGIFTDSK